jgi:hypothetical protein
MQQHCKLARKGKQGVRLVACEVVYSSMLCLRLLVQSVMLQPVSSPDNIYDSTCQWACLWECLVKLSGCLQQT